MAAMEDFQHMESKSLRDLQILSEIERTESVTQRFLSTKLGIAWVSPISTSSGWPRRATSR